MKILVISGFLGAGKTTFIQTMSRKTGHDFCVYENEYAQADIDKALLSQTAGLNIWEMTENCICCSGKQDFASSVLTISNTLDPEYLIVEPTGVAKLSAILNNLKKVEYERITLLPPVTIIDGTTLHRDLQGLGAIYQDQLITAPRIVVSKMEGASEAEKKAAWDLLHKQNSQAEIITSPYEQQPDAWWQSLLQDSPNGAYNFHPDKGRLPGQAPEIPPETLSLADVQLPSPVHLISLLEMITFGVYGRIIRAKGFLPCGKEWYRFDIVDTTYSITGFTEQPQANVVFIGTDIHRQGLRQALSFDRPAMRYVPRKAHPLPSTPTPEPLPE